MPSTWDPYYQTPFAARSVAVFIVLVYLSGFIVGDSPATYAYAPFMLATQGRVVSLFISPFVTDSLIGLLFTCMMLVQVGSHVETALGTAHFLLLSAAFMLTSTIVFSLLVLGLGSTIMPSLLTQYSLGLWPLLLALMIIQTMTSGEEHHRLLCLPLNVPTKWYPVALLALFTLFAGIKLDFFVMVGIAHQYASGKLNVLTPSEHHLAKIEELFGRLAHSPGFVPRTAATGFVVPIGASEGAGWSMPQLPAWNLRAQDNLNPSFTGQGQTIGSATPVSAATPSQTASELSARPLDALIAMGFDRSRSQAALRESNGDLSRAVDSLSASSASENV